METVKAKKYHHGNLEEALVLAGLREAQESGTRNLGVTFLAKAVSVSPMAVYRHFASGESLKAAISQKARELLARRMQEAAEAASGTTNRFLALGDAYIHFALTEPGLFSVAFVAWGVAPAREDDPSAWGVLQAGIQELCDDGLIEQSAAESVAAFAWSSVYGFAMLATGLDPACPHATPEDIYKLLDLVWDGILGA